MQTVKLDDYTDPVTEQYNEYSVLIKLIFYHKCCEGCHQC